jgi:hypothetical protein
LNTSDESEGTCRFGPWLLFELFEVRVNELLAAAGLLAFKSPASRKSIARVRSFKEKLRGVSRPSFPAAMCSIKKWDMAAFS